MPIQILPARLANQIAAGEVVERPASVVKELIENSLDAGATRIELDIEKGGAKRILIRDNGSGIAKEELVLALSRHATSKISSLDDLEAIQTLGFRGEALASISSVARLTLTSRTQDQAEAYLAYAEGRDMAVQLKPAAHPVGTSVDVVDLFFNTPARRKFLRTEKTEFNHIDALLKRLALSKFDVAISLRHNGSLLRQYQPAFTQVQKEKRLALVCGNAFVQAVVELKLEHHDLSLHGWIAPPSDGKNQSDVQYCFVNKRMMKDKLINHAIRQACETALGSEQFASYVLFITIDPHQLDVNVHPAKHEVRFHQARFVHDFIFQAVADALSQAKSLSPLKKNTTALAYSSRLSLGEKAQKKPAERYGLQDHGVKGHGVQENKLDYTKPCDLKPYQDIYQSLMTTRDEISDNIQQLSDSATKASLVSESVSAHNGKLALGQALAVVEGQYLLIETKEGLNLFDLAKCAYLYQKISLLEQSKKRQIKACPLLMPVLLVATPDEINLLEASAPCLYRFGIVIKKKSEQEFMVMAVCPILKQADLQKALKALLNKVIIHQDEGILAEEIAKWLAQFTLPIVNGYSLDNAIALLLTIENDWQDKLAEHYTSLLRPLDVKATIEAFNNE